MKRTSVAHLPCSVARTIDVIGDRWTVLIVRDVFYGRRRFDDMAASLPIARNVLSRRLADLVDHGILTRRRYSQRPPRDEYLLTDRGRDLFGVVAALMAWGDRWLTPEGEEDPVDLVHQPCGHATTPTVVCDTCRQPLRAADVRVRPNLGQRLPERALATPSSAAKSEAELAASRPVEPSPAGPAPGEPGTAPGADA